MTTPDAPIVSTAQLTYDGWRGYRKTIAGIVALLGSVLAAVQPMLAAGSEWARWVGVAISVCGAIGVYLVPNAVKPTPPAPVIPPDEAPLFDH